MLIQASIRLATTQAELAAARSLMIEYRDSISTPLCFQNFDAEMLALPGKYTPPRGCILLAEVANTANGANAAILADAPNAPNAPNAAGALHAPSTSPLAHASATPRGVIALRELDPSSTRPICEMKRLYVQPHARRHGLARALCTALIEFAKAANYAAMRLDTDEYMRPAQALYHSLGFTPIPKYNDDPIPNTLFYELNLRQPRN